MTRGSGTHGLQSCREGTDDCRHRLDESDDASCCNCSGAHWFDVCSPKIPWAHLANRNKAGVDRMAEIFAEKVDERHDDEPRQHAAREDDARDAGSDNVAHAEIL